jgi:hypothetical protein
VDVTYYSPITKSFSQSDNDNPTLNDPSANEGSICIDFLKLSMAFRLSLNKVRDDS